MLKVKGKQNKKKGGSDSSDTLSKKDMIRLCQKTEDIEVLLQYTHHEDDDVRLAAASQLCPCSVQLDIEEFWERVFEMVDDNDVRIRQRILHIICDGSPPRLETRILDALDKFNHDPDPQIRRTAHKVLAQASRGNSWNIL